MLFTECGPVPASAMNNSTAMEKAFARALHEDELWRKRRMWLWLMIVPTPVILLQWVLLPVPFEEVPGNYAQKFVYVIASWAAICAGNAAAASPPDQGIGRRLI